MKEATFDTRQYGNAREASLFKEGNIYHVGLACGDVFSFESRAFGKMIRTIEDGLPTNVAVILKDDDDDTIYLEILPRGWLRCFDCSDLSYQIEVNFKSLVKAYTEVRRSR